jgi:hypothetical protein
MAHARFPGVIRRHVSVLENQEHPRPNGTGDRPGRQGYSGRKKAHPASRDRQPILQHAPR